MATDRDILDEGREAFRLAAEAEKDNRETAADDLRFARLGQQWPQRIVEKRNKEGRPCLTIPRLNAFIRKVVNDTRQNRPQIKVHPVDSSADPETAKMLDGLIRNIEYSSNAEVAYDTGAESAVAMGWGYWRVGIDYAHDDTFDLDIRIDRVSNPFQIYSDPYSTAADSSDWTTAFVIEMEPKKQFEASYPEADEAPANFDDYYGDLEAPWVEGDTVMKAEWWRREEVERRIVMLSDGRVVDAEWLAGTDEETGIPHAMALQIVGVTPEQERVAKSWKVTQRIMTGSEVLETNDWPGRYIPIPVYGDEVDIEGKRHLRSLIHDAKDAQRMFNYWRTASTEMVALAPRVPYVGPIGAFKTAAKKWATINSESHAFVEYDGPMPPQRQALDMGGAAGALQEALNASDDMKAIVGLYDASLGARSNETSGAAIIARQRQGDVSTFHFADNLSRSIRHGGRVLVDLIPHVYSARRIVRILGEDGTPSNVPINQQVPVLAKDGQPHIGPDGRPATRIYNLTTGKYDVTVASGPSFASRREEAAYQMTELVRAFPRAAPLIMDLLARNLDWPEADIIAERARKILPPQLQEGELPPEVQAMIDRGKELIGKLQAENQELKSQAGVELAKLKVANFDAETNRMKVVGDMHQAWAASLSPEQITAMVYQAVREILSSPGSLDGGGAPPPVGQGGGPGTGPPGPPAMMPEGAGP